ncbi:MAG TPA: hypothetical protein PKC89_14195 [Pyrinomonadaceae bacterium]|nr:hypothetical protein [Pyrinomonadaceae bacterium]
MMMFLFDEVDFVQTQSLPLSDLWYFLPFGYLVTILIETPILLIGLGRKFTFKQKLLAGIWLTACTYPIVVIVLPAVFLGSPRWLYLTVAEVFAPVAECLLFWLAFRGTEAVSWTRTFAVIIIANLASFGLGEILNAYNWFGLF